jgi:hypothetical protein
LHVSGDWWKFTSCSFAGCHHLHLAPPPATAPHGPAASRPEKTQAGERVKPRAGKPVISTARLQQRRSHTRCEKTRRRNEGAAAETAQPARPARRDCHRAMQKKASSNQCH